MLQEEQNQGENNQSEQGEVETPDKIFIVAGSIVSVLVLGIVGIRIWKEKGVTG